ncbi:MAG TPA: biotin/lipoyl-containing protein, partial [Actinomycetota bacterium]|nr:biotin/lipoyl-containing protein [Actinomycetota bacterium]
MTSVKMPQLGETVVEGTILKWLKREGDEVALDEPLFEISTDKVDTEVPSSAAGTLSKILVGEGETVAVGTEVAQIDGEGSSSGGAEEAPTPAEPQPEPPAETPAAEPAAAAPSAADTGAPSSAQTSQPAAEPVPSQMAASQAAPLPDRGPRSQILSPLVRKLAAEHGVDLAQVTGTGTGGRITKKDVLGLVESQPAAAPAAAAAETPQATPTAPAAPAPGAQPAAPSPAQPAGLAGGEEVVPVTHIRRAIAEHMKRSLEVSARAWNAVEVNMENVARLRERAKDAFKTREGFSLTYMPFVTKAVTEALLAHPMVNSELRGEEIALKRFVNMGI